MHDAVLIDGVKADSAWLDDRAFQYGDGLFETIAIVDGSACLWDLHMRRLIDGCDRLHLPHPDVALIERECADLSAGLQHAALKLYWTGGLSQRGYRRSRPLRPRRILRVLPWQPDQADDWTVRLCEHRLSENPCLAGIKHLNRLDQVIARAEWSDPAVHEGLMQDQSGYIVCGTMSNLVIQSGATLITPPVDRAGIAGTVRALLMALGARMSMPVEVRSLSVDDVRDADAVYLSNSLIGVARVARFEARRYDVTQAVHPLIAQTRRACHLTGAHA